MKDYTGIVRKYYDSNVENESGRLVRHPVERDMTWRYLERYLPPEGRILDIGAAAGAYAIPLAERGYSVTAVDLSPGLVAECEKQAAGHKVRDRVTCLVADARDLSLVTDIDYDAVLLLGPLYHLQLEEDRKTVLREAVSRMKIGGILLSSHISRYGIWGDVMNKNPQVIEYRDDIDKVLEGGRDPELPAFGFPAGRPQFLAYYALVTEIAPLHEECGLKTLVTAALEPQGIAVDRLYRELPENQRKLWLDLMFRISAEPSIIGASCHVLYAGEKTG